MEAHKCMRSETLTMEVEMGRLTAGRRCSRWPGGGRWRCRFPASCFQRRIATSRSLTATSVILRPVARPSKLGGHGSLKLPLRVPHRHPCSKAHGSREQRQRRQGTKDLAEGLATNKTMEARSIRFYHDGGSAGAFPIWHHTSGEPPSEDSHVTSPLPTSEQPSAQL